MPTQALSGIKVLDLTHYVAGPYCTKLLADYGADVIKVERPGIGEGGRRLGPFPQDKPHPEKSGLFLFLNTNKRGITLNLKTVTGKALFRRLAEWADVLVENFSPRVMPNLGLGYATLKAWKPSLVMTSISNFGQTGPYRDYRAVDMTTLAMGGVMYISGEAEREPVRFAGPQSQFHGGLVASVATLGALQRARRLGMGDHVDVALMESTFNVIELDVMMAAYSGEARKRTGSQIGNYPWSIYRCKDGYIAICVNNRQWRRIGEWIGMPEISRDPSLATPAQRYERFDEMEAIFVPYFLERTKAELTASGQAARIPVIAVNTPADMLADPHYQARGFFVDIDHPVAGKFNYPGPPFALGSTPWQLRRPAPRLGEHNEWVYGGLLGYPRQDLVGLCQNGVI